MSKWQVHIARAGNLNCLSVLSAHGCTASESSACFKLGGLNLSVRDSDIPLMKNLEELGRKALRKQLVRDFLAERAYKAEGALLMENRAVHQGVRIEMQATRDWLAKEALRAFSAPG